MKFWIWNNIISPFNFFLDCHYWKIKHGGVKFWWWHNIQYSQRFPWPGFWETLRDPFYRKIYFENSATNRDIFVRIYQFIKIYERRIRTFVRVWWARK